MSTVQISIIVPTYAEAENIPLLADEIDKVLSAAGYRYEIIVCDDVSGDDTEAVCAALGRRLPLRLLSRTTNRGLSPAVIEGMALAEGEVVLVMDADLSHPPEKIPDMADLLLNKAADFVIGSRYVKGGALDKDWPWWRRLNSIAATIPARLLVPLADPMSGFFALRRADVPPAEQLSPVGYKIGLELLVKAGFSKQRVREVPILFRDRIHGESKMNLREQLNYLRHLRRLYHHRWPRYLEILQFLCVGAGGLVVDMTVYLLLLAAGAPYLWARGIAYWPAVTFNWLANRRITFSHRPRRPRLAQWLQFSIACGIGFIINWGTYALLIQTMAFFAHYHILALLIGVLVGTGFNYFASDLLIFRVGKRR